MVNIIYGNTGGINNPSVSGKPNNIYHQNAGRNCKVESQKEK